MLQTYQWRLKLDGKPAEKVAETMRALAAVLVRTRPVLRGLRLSGGPGDTLEVFLRVAGHSRWAIQADARKLIIILLRRVFIIPANLELVQVTTERNGRDLYLGEGRTPMNKTPRAPRQADGSLWADYEWWGDDLSGLAQESQESPSGTQAG